MLQQERVTVIVPTYHHAQLLRQTLLSILNQTVPLKVIIVPVLEDKETLSELEHLNECLCGFGNVAYIVSEKADPFIQMQLGLYNVDTEYFSVFGSDDVMLPNMVERMLELADQSKEENVIVGLSFAYTNEKLTITSLHKMGPFSFNRMMKGSCIPDIALVKTKYAKLVGGFNDGHDWGYLSHFAFYHRLLKQTNPTVILSPEVGFLYRQLPNSRHAVRYATKEGIKIHRGKMREIARYYWGC